MGLFIQKLIWHSCVIAALLSFSQALRAEVVVVTGAQRSPFTLSQNQVRDLFLGKATSLPDGKSATPIDQPESNPLRDEFYSKVTNKSASQAKAIRAKLYFTGRGAPPREGTSSEDIKKMLNSTPGGIGYIEQTSLDSSVKAIQIVEQARVNEAIKTKEVKGDKFGE